jgi:hypothetical protein
MSQEPIIGSKKLVWLLLAVGGVQSVIALITLNQTYVIVAIGIFIAAFSAWMQSKNKR